MCPSKLFMLHYYGLLVIFQHIDSGFLEHSVYCDWLPFPTAVFWEKPTIVDFVRVCGRHAPQNLILCMRAATNVLRYKRNEKQVCEYGCRYSVLLEPSYFIVRFCVIAQCLFFGTPKHMLTLWKSRDITVSWWNKLDFKNFKWSWHDYCSAKRGLGPKGHSGRQPKRWWCASTAGGFDSFIAVHTVASYPGRLGVRGCSMHATKHGPMHGCYTWFR